MILYSGSLKPLAQMQILGFSVMLAEPMPIADCWMMHCNAWPTTWPSYIQDATIGRL